MGLGMKVMFDHSILSLVGIVTIAPSYTVVSIGSGTNIMLPYDCRCSEYIYRHH
jgi:hypothetical protein